MRQSSVYIASIIHQLARTVRGSGLWAPILFFVISGCSKADSDDFSAAQKMSSMRNLPTCGAENRCDAIGDLCLCGTQDNQCGIRRCTDFGGASLLWGNCSSDQSLCGGGLECKMHPFVADSYVCGGYCANIGATYGVCDGHECGVKTCVNNLIQCRPDTSKCGPTQMCALDNSADDSSPYVCKDLAQPPPPSTCSAGSYIPCDDGSTCLARHCVNGQYEATCQPEHKLCTEFNDGRCIAANPPFTTAHCEYGVVLSTPPGNRKEICDPMVATYKACGNCGRRYCQGPSSDGRYYYSQTCTKVGSLCQTQFPAYNAQCVPYGEDAFSCRGQVCAGNQQIGQCAFRLCGADGYFQLSLQPQNSYCPAGYRCEASESPTLTSSCKPDPVQSCTPNCNGKCAGASDGCGGICSSSSTCAGCCDANHICRSGSAQYQCGTFGVTCKDCTPLGQQCLQGAGPGTWQCRVPPPSCTPNCNGKCAGASNGCGGTCQSNRCGGCCDGTTCRAGTMDNQCGKSGQSCQKCTPIGICQNQQCAISSAPVCNGTTCPNGCCYSGVCKAGTSNTQCGRNGSTCDSCQQNGLICQNHSCILPD